MKCKGKMIDLSIDYATNRPRITFLLESKSDLLNIEEIASVDKLSIEAKKWREKRSLDANAYCWVLIHKLAEKLKLKPLEVYKRAIYDTGVCQVLPLKENAVDRFVSVWEANGLGWFCERFPSKLDKYVNVKAYYGSSSYDTEEMSRLLENIIADCKEQNIETMKDTEYKSLIESWCVK